jgi:hypothetical protein
MTDNNTLARANRLAKRAIRPFGRVDRQTLIAIRDEFLVRIQDRLMAKHPMNGDKRADGFD